MTIPTGRRVGIAGFIIFCGALGAGAGRAQQQALELEVCVHDNPPVVALEAGVPVGLAIDVLEAVAAEDRWNLEYVPGTWARCMELLHEGAIDLIVGIAYSDSRARLYRFSRETLISNFGMVYVPSDRSVDSILDLEGARVAVVRGNIHSQAFAELADGLDLDWSEVPVDTFEEGLSLVAAGAADAGVASRLYVPDDDLRRALRPSGVIFNPIEIRYAAPLAGSAEVLEAIDAYLEEQKATPGSRYYASLGRWVPGALPPVDHRWRWLAAGALAALALAVGLSLWLRREVARRTAELEERGRELGREVRRRRVAQENLARAAFTDPMTGLPSRFVLRDRLDQAVETAARRGERLGVLVLDVDRLQSINDSYGHALGDEILVRLIDRLRQCVPQGATLGRLVGDEFLVLLPQLRDGAQLAGVAQELLSTARRPFAAAERSLVVSLSIGGAVFPDDADGAEALIARADAATRHVKSRGRDAYARYVGEMSRGAVERRAMERRVRKAVAESRVRLHYQPIVDLESRELVGVEALVRLPGEADDLLLPELFIPLAEEAGLVSALGRLILETATQEAKTWKGMPAGWRLAINVSPQQLEADDFVRQLDGAAAAGGLPLDHLELELTEGVHLDGLQSRGPLLAELAQRGVTLSVDDFGTGYSSLAYLMRLPISTVKIDQSFVHDAVREAGAAEIVRAISSLSRGLGLRCIGEGIETAGQLELLRDAGCRYGQGFYLGRPMPGEDLQRWIDSRAT